MAYREGMRMSVLASGSKGNSAVVSSGRTRILVDAGLSCRELLRRMAAVGEDPCALTAILITHEHQDHVAGLAVLARRLELPVFLTEPTHRAWVRAMTPRTTMSYAQWLETLAAERESRAAAMVPTYAATTSERPMAPQERRGTTGGEGAGGASMERETATMAGQETAGRTTGGVVTADGAEGDCGRGLASGVEEEGRAAGKAALPAVEYFRAGTPFRIGDIDVQPFTIPHDAADPCGFVFQAAGIRMAIATDLGYMPPNVKAALSGVDVLLLESNHDLEMLKDGPYPWSVKQRVLSRVGHLSNLATAEFLARDYDGGAHTIILGHLSEANNAPELARLAAEEAIGDRMRLLGNRILLAEQHAPLEPVCL